MLLEKGVYWNWPFFLLSQLQLYYAYKLAWEHMNSTSGFQRTFYFCVGKNIGIFIIIFFTDANSCISCTAKNKLSFPSRDLAPFPSTRSHPGLLFFHTGIKCEPKQREVMGQGNLKAWLWQKQVLSERTEMKYREGEPKTMKPRAPR